MNMYREDAAKRIRELIDILNHAGLVYYQEGREIMPNIEYDRLYDELLDLEAKTGIILPDSPTQNVGHEIVSELPKERHASPMLSLNKTKSPEELKEWMNGQLCVLSWKLDGITCVVTYEGGKLTKAVTRGNGEVGEVVTANARYFVNLPDTIPFKGQLVLRGEAVISYSDFEKINEEIADTAATYKNPRNLCSGSVRQLDPRVTAGRRVRLIVFTLVSAQSLPGAPEVPDFHNSFSARFDWLDFQGFETVEHVMSSPDTIFADIANFKERIPGYDIPSDGLVLSYEDVAYGLSLGRTAKFPRHSIAFKWQDELAETTLRDVDWSGSRTGLINPVAVFDPVELEGTTVTRASVHNVSIVEELKLGIGDRIKVYKANMIIPQISENLTGSGTLRIPEICPVCAKATEIRQENTAKLLYCTNPDCPAKKIRSFALMVSRNALNIDGLSEMTLEKLIDAGMIREYADLFRMEDCREEIAQMEGFGEKSADNLINAAHAASEGVELSALIYGLGIPGIGLSGARAVCRAFQSDLQTIMSLGKEELTKVSDIGPVLAENFVNFFSDEENRRKVNELAKLIHFAEAPAVSGNELIFAGITFVVTGELRHFSNRDELKKTAEALGGKVAGSVSQKTSYLINNDAGSSSTKNLRARELGVPIITEDEWIAMLPEAMRP